MRLAAEAWLVLEQQRYQPASSGSFVHPVSSGSTEIPAIGANSGRCGQAKAGPGNAYRVVGTNRTYDLVRRWNDIRL